MCNWYHRRLTFILLEFWSDANPTLVCSASHAIYYDNPSWTLDSTGPSSWLSWTWPSVGDTCWRLTCSRLSRIRIVLLYSEVEWAVEEFRRVTNTVPKFPDRSLGSWTIFEFFPSKKDEKRHCTDVLNLIFQLSKPYWSIWMEGYYCKVWFYVGDALFCFNLAGSS